MEPVQLSTKGDFKRTIRYLKRIIDFDPMTILSNYGAEGVAALQRETPVRTGLTAASWGYKVEKDATGYKLTFTNNNVVNGVMIAIILQYGHGTGTGGWVEGRDYINPALRPIFDRLARDAWKEVKDAG